MKKSLLAFLICFICRKAFSQATYIPFPDSVAEWTYYTINTDGFNDFFTNFETIRMEGDTTINGLNYKKLSGAFNGVLREANKIVYAISFQASGNWSIYPINEEFVLYNFNEGDTIFVPDNFLDSIYTVGLFDTITLNGVDHKAYALDSFYNGWDIPEIIEGIGSTLTFGSSARYFPFEHTSKLVCFHDFKRNIEYSYSGYLSVDFNIQYPYDDCYFYVGEEELTKGSKITVFPNPVQDELNIQGLTETTQVQVQNLMGQTLLSQTINQNETVNLKTLSKGVYLITLIDKDGNHQKLGKIIKE